jgi:hypothetical protein
VDSGKDRRGLKFLEGSANGVSVTACLEIIRGEGWRSVHEVVLNTIAAKAWKDQANADMQKTLVVDPSS